MLVALALIIGLVATGCGKGSTSGTSSGAGSDKPVKGGTLHRAFSYGGDPGSLDPAFVSRIGQSTVSMELFDTLVMFDPVQKKIMPGLAEKWEASPDSKEFVFHLRKGAKFHNGREVEAKDVKYTLERLIDPETGSPSVGRWKDIAGAEDMIAKKAKEVKGIQTPDKYTVKISLDRSNPIFLISLSSTSAGIVPKEAVDKYGKDFGHNPVGSGPFIFESWKIDDRIIIKANDSYWGGRPYVDKVEYRVLPEASTREAEFLAGNLDYIVLSDAQYRQYSADPKWKNNLLEVAELFTREIGFNVTKAPFDKKEVRQAVNYAIDKNAIIKNVLGGKAFPATGVLPPSIAGYNPELKGYEYNVAKAKELLAKAGYPNGFEAEILCTDNKSWGLPAVEATMQYLSAVGIKLKPMLMDGNAMTDKLRRGDFTSYMYSVGSETHPLAYVYYRFHSKNATGNFMKYSNPAVDKLLDEAMATSSFDEQVKKVQEAEKIIVEDAPWFFFNYNKAVVMYQPWLKGLKQTPNDMDLQEMKDVWLTKTKK